MDLRQLTPDIAVSAQITAEDVDALAEAGFKVLINNRPDAEVGPGLDSESIGMLAQQAGLEYRYIPFTPGEITPQMISAFAEAMSLPGPKAAYCRSGNRSTVLWALSQAHLRPTDELTEIGARAGYDLSGVRPLLESLAR